MKRFQSLTKTCDACPSQWEGILKDGRHIYIRYRWGNLGIGIGATALAAIGNYEYGIDVGDEFDGSMTTEEMLGPLSEILARVEG